MGLLGTRDCPFKKDGCTTAGSGWTGHCANHRCTVCDEGARSVRDAYCKDHVCQWRHNWKHGSCRHKKIGVTRKEPLSKGRSNFCENHACKNCRIRGTLGDVCENCTCQKSACHRITGGSSPYCTVHACIKCGKEPQVLDRRICHFCA